MTDSIHFLKNIFYKSLHALNPGNLVHHSIKRQGTVLNVQGDEYELNSYRKRWLFGVGKASSQIAAEMEVLLGDKLSGGLIITKYDHAANLNKVKVLEAGHPVPDENSIASAKVLRNELKNTNQHDLVIFLVSGGGSALLGDIPNELSLDQWKNMNSRLLSRGADIREINLLRKYYGTLKGGKLLNHLNGATCLTLILSDVIGDPLKDIASGPTVRQEAPDLDRLMAIHRKFEIPFINVKTAFTQPPPLSRNRNYLIGSNIILLNEIKSQVSFFGYKAEILDTSYAGPVDVLVRSIVHEIEEPDRQVGKWALIYGGEPTVEVKSEGKGGRNQHLALDLALRIQSKSNITILCAGSDGTDGPTDAAGAIVGGHTIAEINRDALDYLSRFDSYNYFKNTEFHLKTGPTATNVMDVLLILIDNQS